MASDRPGGGESPVFDDRRDRLLRQLGGLLFAALGAGFIGWVWHTATTARQFSFKAAVFGPALLVSGLGLVAFPTCSDERADRGEDISELGPVAPVTPRWWAVFAAAAAAAGANYYLLTARLAGP